MNREDEGIAVALVDLDGFKALNQDHGYAAGDQVLAATLVRLQGAVGSGIVARFGSDEFAVLLGGVEMPRRGRHRRSPGGRGLGADQPRRSQRPRWAPAWGSPAARPATRGPRT